MFGLAIIFFFLLYLVIWVLLVIGAAYLGLRVFKTKKAMFILGVIGFLFGYWPAFGDLIPTLWAHKQLCEKEAGFKVLKDVDEWSFSNPGVLENLFPYKKFTVKDHVVLGNERIGVLIEKKSFDAEAIQKINRKIIDIKTNEVLATYIDFIRGYGQFGVSDDVRSVKFWLFKNSCYSIEELKAIDNKKDVYLEKLKFK